MALQHRKDQINPNIELGNNPPPSYDQYTIAWICALPIELAAARVMLDKVHQGLPGYKNDSNAYTLGSAERHNIVIACLPTAQYGTNSAANLITNLIRTFPSIRLGLMVGIGGGVPTKVDMHLGDVVVGTTVVQYDLGKIVGSGEIQRTAVPKSLHHLLGTAVSSLQAKHEQDSNRISLILEEKFGRSSKWSRPMTPDRLFKPEYEHVTLASSCDGCDCSKLVPRVRRSTNKPIIYYGTVASSNQVMRNGNQRDNISQQINAICFEMETAGLMDVLPCLPIRGICDYSDSHKNKEWQNYAAATAAAYAKELLAVIPIAEAQAELFPAPNLSQMSFQIAFSLEGIPVTNNFVDRPSDRAALEQCLLPQRSPTGRRKVCVLHGLGGIGKTQLAIDFARRHKAVFSSIFWLDGRSEDHLRQCFMKCLARIPDLQTASYKSGLKPNSREYVDAAVASVMTWLAQPDNTNWLLIFDNVDQSYHQGGVTGAYSIGQYLPGDQGSVLITTRLSRLQQLGKSKHLSNVDLDQSKAILQAWYGGQLHWSSDFDILLQLLQGLPLALAQAASYLRETGMDITTYIQLYNQQWQKLMHSDDPLMDYHQGSIVTTWSVSLEAIKTHNTSAIDLLRLWAYLDNKCFCHDMIQAAKSTDPGIQWPFWLSRIANDVVYFTDLLRLLVRYSMVQIQSEPTGNYTMHPVVHRWVLHLDSHDKKKDFARLAVLLVSKIIPTQETEDYWILQQRILPHAEQCSVWIQENLLQPVDTVICKGFYALGILYEDQGKIFEAEAMYSRALEGFEKLLGGDHISTIHTVHLLGKIYMEQGNYTKAQTMFDRALAGSEKALGHEQIWTIGILHSLGDLFLYQEKLDEAEGMYNRALEGYEKILGGDHITTLSLVNNLGLLYMDQGKPAEAIEPLFDRALEGHEKKLGYNHPLTLAIVSNLGSVYHDQNKLAETEAMCHRALDGYRKTLGPDHLSTLTAINNLGSLYKHLGKVAEADAMYNQALQGFQSTLGQDHPKTKKVVNSLWLLHRKPYSWIFKDFNNSYLH